MDEFERLFQDHFYATYDYVYYMLGNPADTQNITEKVFHKIALSYHQWQEDEPVHASVFKLARRTTVDFLGKGKHHATTITPLSENMRSVLYLRFIKGLSVQETAKYMDVTPKLVSVIENEALAKLAEEANKTEAPSRQ